MEIDFGLPGSSDSVKLGDEPVRDQGHSCYQRCGELIACFGTSKDTPVVNLQGHCRQNRSPPS